MPDKDQSKRTRRGSGAITLSDVATLAGVAPITASRALNKPDQVSPDVLQRVLDAVEKTGYVPNRMAGALASSRSRLIAAVVPSTVMSVFVETIEALNASLFDAGYQLMVGQSDYSPQREEALLEAVIGRRPDGIFLTGLLRTGRARNRLVASGIPVLETWDLTPTPIDMLIGFSHSAIGQEVAQFLHAKGRRRFGMIMADDERAARRAEAFAATVEKLGCAPVHRLSVGAQRSMRSGRHALASLMQEAPEVDAIFCSSDLLALGAITEARALGIEVPKRLAVLGFGDVPFAADSLPALSTVRINGSEIGRLGARWLIDRAEGRQGESHILDIGFAIVEREST
jgi:LacI family transcriptional regulator, gluconate utilization system Gnt-I transcriptional repressor